MTTDQKGAIAEAAVASAATDLGIVVSKPLFAPARYDLVFDDGEKLLRVQCKWANLRDEIVLIRCYANRRGPNGMVRTLYARDEIDAFAAYCRDLDRCYFLPADEFLPRSHIHLRLGPALNNQELRIHWAADWEFGATLGRPEGP